MVNEFTTSITPYAQNQKNFFFLNSFLKTSKREKASSLCFKKKTHINLEKSSTKTKKIITTKTFGFY